MLDNYSPEVSGASSSLRSLLAYALRQSPWLHCTEDHLVFDWPEALQAWPKKDSANLDARVAQALSELLPSIPLSLFATTSPSPNYFQGEERLAGLTQQTQPLEADLEPLLADWGREVRRFSQVMRAQMQLAEEQSHDPSFGPNLYKDGLVQKVLATAEALASVVGFQQTLNIRFNLTHRVTLAAAEVVQMLTDAGPSSPYKRSLGRRHEVRHELLQLIRLRLDLLAHLSAEVPAPDLLEATLASLSRREQALYKLLHPRPADERGFNMLAIGPGFALRLGDGRSLPFNLSPYANTGSMLRSFDDQMTHIRLPPQSQMLATGVRLSIPDAYRLTTKHATQEGRTAGSIFVTATERLQAQLRRLETPDLARTSEIDASTFAAAEAADQALQWAFSASPLLTLLLSGFLATYRAATSWGFALSPWVVANALSERVLKATPLTYYEPMASKPVVGPDEDHPYFEADPTLPLTTGGGIWLKFMLNRLG